MRPHATGTAYVNFMPGDESERVETAYGAIFGRLAQMKRRYDPSNLFRMNQERKTFGSVTRVLSSVPMSRGIRHGETARHAGKFFEAGTGNSPSIGVR